MDADLKQMPQQLLGGSGPLLTAWERRRKARDSLPSVLSHTCQAAASFPFLTLLWMKTTQWEEASLLKLTLN